MHFPPELWELILLNIEDPTHLVRVQRVCKSWYHIIQRILPHSIKWKQLCLNTIPDHCLVSVINMIYPTTTRDPCTEEFSSIMWKNIYVSFCKWKLCFVLQPSIETKTEFPSFSKYEIITSTDVWADNIVIGTDEGLIYICKIDCLDHVIFRADHKSHVRQVKFWPNDDALLVVSSCVNSHLKFWNIDEKKELVSRELRGSHIKTVGNMCFCVFGNVSTWYTHDAGNIRTRGSLRSHSIFTRDWKPLTFMFTRGEVLGVYRNSDNLEIRHMSCIVDDYAFSTCSLNNTTLWLPDDELIRLPTVCSLITVNCVEDSFFLVTCHNYVDLIARYVNVRKRLNLDNIITSAVHHGNMFIVGMNSGALRMFHLSTELEFDERPFEKSKTIIVDNDPITSLHMTEYEEKQFIIATTERNVHTIRFSSNLIY